VIAISILDDAAFAFTPGYIMLFDNWDCVTQNQGCVKQWTHLPWDSTITCDSADHRHNVWFMEQK